MFFVAGVIVNRVLIPAAAVLVTGLAAVVVKRADERTKRRVPRKRPRRKPRRK